MEQPSEDNSAEKFFKENFFIFQAISALFCFVSGLGFCFVLFCFLKCIQNIPWAKTWVDFLNPSNRIYLIPTNAYMCQLLLFIISV